MKINKRNMIKDTGKRLEEFRKGLEYDRVEMAAYLGLKLSAYYKNEKGVVFPNLGTLHQLATKNNLSMDWFFFNKGPMYYDDKEKIKETGELRKQLAQAQQSLMELEREIQVMKEMEKQKEKEATQGDKKPEIKELIKDMETVPLLYHEIFAHYQRFKIENKALIENI
ncbi:MAG: helix-turn-helix domain-containing protein [Acidobacteria bacterium]|jgi:transcriptional regulator with XRE-family HTH domain|nr:helix-turn-helix domain-containing protein [Acidobacteriota bacterium]